MTQPHLFERYQDLQRYVGWGEEDSRRIAAAGEIVRPHFAELTDDFYAEIMRHPAAAKVITGGDAQVERLKGTLRSWLLQLFSSPHDRDYVLARWQVGLRHVEIGLDQVYTNVALSRIRNGLIEILCNAWSGPHQELVQTVKSLNGSGTV